MNDSRAKLAALNNAIWCNTLCIAHGSPGEFRDDAWVNRKPVPGGYPNVVTLSTKLSTDTEQNLIKELSALGLPAYWAVKDSFCEMNLDAQAFQQIFTATWIWHDQSTSLPKDWNPDLSWKLLTDPSQLAPWEMAWSANPEENPSSSRPQLFLPSLMLDPNIQFVAAFKDDKIIAGAIANRTGTVVGLSNLFAPTKDRTLYWTGCVSAIHDHFPGLPIVGYEHDQDLIDAQDVGFEKLQDLRVFIHKDS